MAVPTLAADEALDECLLSLSRQTFREFEIIVIDNSGRGLVRERGVASTAGARLLEMDRNIGFGAAINAAFAASSAAYLATLNDDAVAWPGWLGALIGALDRRPDVGLCASQVRLAGEGLLDSAGMLLCADGSSKQRGHRRRPKDFGAAGEVLLPSGSAALYRRAMLEEIGGFDPDFFLYCEDTDLGLRARRAGWRCWYAPEARVEHRYSHSAGRVSALKAYLVERNRLFVAVKNLPLPALLLSPLVSLRRYFWHAIYMVRGRGAAGQFHQEGSGAWQLGWYVLKAHLSVLRHLPRLWRKRSAIAKGARVPAGAYRRLLRRFAISPREIARL